MYVCIFDLLQRAAAVSSSAVLLQGAEAVDF